MGRFGLILQPGCVPAPRPTVTQRARVLARLQFTFQESVRIPIQRMYMNQSIVPKQRKPRNSNRIPVLIIIREDAPPGIESECIWKLECSKLWTTGFAAFQVSCKSKHKPRRSVFPNLKRIHVTQTYPYTIRSACVQSPQGSRFVT